MISPDDLSALMGSGEPHALLDVRERGRYERGHIFGATSLPRRLLEFRLPGLVTARATPVILGDDDGSLSELVRPTLAEMGFADVRVLTGGLAAWRAQGRRLVQGVNVPSKVFGERVLHEEKTPEIGAAELHDRMAKGERMVIVDARTAEEYARGCIPGAWSVPGGELVLRIGDLVSSPETTIVVHCGGRTRSYIGAESLRRMNLPNPVLALLNGTMGWELAGFALERGASRRPPPVSELGRSVAERVAARVAAEDGIAFLSPDDLRRLWARRDLENVYLLDVRLPEEYEAGHLPGAISAPGGQAVQATDDLVLVRGATIVFVCDGSVRAVMTAAWFRRMGFPRVLVLGGGLPAWLEARGALEVGQPASLPAGFEAARASVPSVTASILNREVKGGTPPLILSLDQSDAYARGHVPGALWLCRSRLELGIGAVAQDRDRPIVVTCADGVHSTLAGATLTRLGYARVRVLEGGGRAWAAAGLPVEVGPTGLADEADDVVLKPSERGREAMQAYLRWEEALDAEGQSPFTLLVDSPPRSGGKA